MRRLLNTYPEIDVLVSQNDDMTFGALEAIQSAGRTTGTGGDITVISFDGTKKALEKVGADRVVVPEREMGFKLAQALLFHLRTLGARGAHGFLALAHKIRLFGRGFLFGRFLRFVFRHSGSGRILVLRSRPLAGLVRAARMMRMVLHIFVRLEWVFHEFTFVRSVSSAVLKTRVQKAG